MTSDPNATNPPAGLPRIDLVAAAKIAAQATAAAVAAGGIGAAAVAVPPGKAPGSVDDHGADLDPGVDAGGPAVPGHIPGTRPVPGPIPGPGPGLVPVPGPVPIPGLGLGLGSQSGAGGEIGKKPGGGTGSVPIVVGKGAKPAPGGGHQSAGAYEGWGRWVLLFPALFVGTLLWWLADSISTRQEISSLTSKMQTAVEGRRKAEAEVATLRDDLGTRGREREAETAKLAAALASAEAKIGSIEREKAELRKRLAEFETGGKDASDALANLKTDLDKTRADLKTANDEIATLKASVATQTAEVKRLADALAARDADLAKAVAVERQKIEAEMGALKSEAAAATASLKQLKDQHAKPQGSATETKADLAAVKLCRNAAAEAIKASPIRFERARAVLASDSAATIAKVVSALKLCPGAAVRIEGHTDTDNRSGRNEELSRERADAVRQALVAGGIDGGLLTATGCGHANPIFPNEATTAEKEANRRIEFVVEDRREPCRGR